jgi:hypothetical protein
METSMDNELRDGNLKLANGVPAKPEVDNGADWVGFWFAAAVMVAVVIASVIVYRTANANMVVALHDATPPPAAELDPVAPPPIIR